MEVDPTDLELLAFDAFNLFGTDPTTWPDKVEINRNGEVDANIVGTWRYDREREFYHVPFTRPSGIVGHSRGTSPGDSGGAE